MSADPTDLEGGDALGRLMVGHIRSERRSLGLYALLSSISAIAAAIQPWLMGESLDATLDSGTSRIIWCLLAITCAIALAIGCNVSRHVVAERLELRFAAQLRTRLGVKVAHAPAAVATHTSPSHVATVAASDIDRVAGYPVARIRLLSSLLGMAVVIGYLTMVSQLITVLVIVGVPAFIWLTARIAGPLEELQDSHRDALGTVTALSADIGHGLRIVRGLRAEKVAHARLDTASRQTETAGVRVAQLQALLLVSGQFLPGVFLALLILVAGHLAVKGSIPAGSLVTIYAASGYLFLPITSAADFLGTRSGARVSARRAMQVLDAPERDHDGTLAPVPLRGDLVDYSSGISAPGGVLTVISAPDLEALGRRLSGLNVSAGELAGHPISSYCASELRSAVRYEGPRATMFSGTVRELLDPHGRHTDTDLLEVLDITSSREIIDRLEGGLEAHIHADGRSLSGGQRQRLALARGLLGNPPYLILVDPTTALDSATEVDVAARVAERRRGLTTVVLTHSGAFRVLADHIVTADSDVSVPASGSDHD